MNNAEQNELVYQETVRDIAKGVSEAVLKRAIRAFLRLWRTNAPNKDLLELAKKIEEML